MQTPQISERLRQTEGVHMGVDLVDYEDAVEKAILFAVGNSVVTDTVNEAREISKRFHIKVAAADGTLIAVNGAMSGGQSRYTVISCAVLTLQDQERGATSW